MWITGASYSIFFVLTKTDRCRISGCQDSLSRKMLRAFPWVKKPTWVKGAQILDDSIDNVRVSKDNLVGGSESGGWMNAMKAFDVSRPNIAAHATGLARASYEHALQYSNERMTFGKPLHKHQAIQFMLADMKTKIEASRMLTWKSANESDEGIRNTESAAHAKRFAADTAMEVSTDAVQIFGGYGYSEEYPVARLMRAAKVMQIYEGSSQVQRMIIGREITKDF